ncbi:MAG TPA: hypothetical protein VNM14_16650 [Planctomycetota bacterium]|jgi:hypothetical protein|nr:hypothetical protein [Planctomycetota bacterium]
MIFHPTARERFTYLLILVVCVGLVVASIFFVVRRPGGGYGQTLAITSGLLLVAVYLNWMAYSVTVRLQDQGVDWIEGKNKGSLAWDNIAGFGWKAERKYLRVGLVEKSSSELKILPFISPALYAALQPRVGRLPAEIEQKLGFKV